MCKLEKDEIIIGARNRIACFILRVIAPWARNTFCEYRYIYNYRIYSGNIIDISILIDV